MISSIFLILSVPSQWLSSLESGAEPPWYKGAHFDGKLYYLYMVKIIFIYIVDVKPPSATLCIYFYEFWTLLLKILAPPLPWVFCFRLLTPTSCFFLFHWLEFNLLICNLSCISLMPFHYNNLFHKKKDYGLVKSVFSLGSFSISDELARGEER